VQLLPSLPDTTGVRLAYDELQATKNEMIVNHSLRTFLFASEYARNKGKKHDPEALAIASLMHDIGLCNRTREAGVPFTWRSADGINTEKMEIKAEQGGEIKKAIELHLRLLPPWGEGNIPGLLQVGAWLDVTFLRAWSISPEYRRFVNTIFPRMGITWKFLPILLGTIDSVATVRNLFRGR
jgi:HD domain